MQNMFHGLGQDISCIKFLEVSDFERHCSNDTKEADILNRLGFPLKGVKLGGI